MDLINMFNMIDTDQSGEITHDELVSFMVNKKYTDEFVEKWLNLFDLNNRGRISIEDFCERLGLEIDENMYIKLKKHRPSALNLDGLDSPMKIQDSPDFDEFVDVDSNLDQQIVHVSVDKPLATPIHRNRHNSSSSSTGSGVRKIGIKEVNSFEDTSSSQKETIFSRMFSFEKHFPKTSRKPQRNASTDTKIVKEKGTATKPKELLSSASQHPVSVDYVDDNDVFIHAITANLKNEAHISPEETNKGKIQQKLEENKIINKQHTPAQRSSFKSPPSKDKIQTFFEKYSLSNLMKDENKIVPKITSVADRPIGRPDVKDNRSHNATSNKDRLKKSDFDISKEEDHKNNVEEEPIKMTYNKPQMAAMNPTQSYDTSTDGMKRNENFNRNTPPRKVTETNPSVQDGDDYKSDNQQLRNSAASNQHRPNIDINDLNKGHVSTEDKNKTLRTNKNDQQMLGNNPVEEIIEKTSSKPQFARISFDETKKNTSGNVVQSGDLTLKAESHDNNSQGNDVLRKGHLKDADSVLLKNNKFKNIEDNNSNHNTFDVDKSIISLKNEIDPPTKLIDKNQHNTLSKESFNIADEMQKQSNDYKYDPSIENKCYGSDNLSQLNDMKLNENLSFKFEDGSHQSDHKKSQHERSLHNPSFNEQNLKCDIGTILTSNTYQNTDDTSKNDDCSIIRNKQQIDNKDDFSSLVNIDGMKLQQSIANDGKILINPSELKTSEKVTCNNETKQLTNLFESNIVPSSLDYNEREINGRRNVADDIQDSELKSDMLILDAIVPKKISLTTDKLNEEILNDKNGVALTKDTEMLSKNDNDWSYLGNRQNSQVLGNSDISTFQKENTERFDNFHSVHGNDEKIETNCFKPSLVSQHLENEISIQNVDNSKENSLNPSSSYISMVPLKDQNIVNIQDFSFETLPTKLKTNESTTQDVDDYFSKLNTVTSLNDSLNKSPNSSKILEANADNSSDVLTSLDSSKYNNSKETSLSPSSSYTSTVPLKDQNIVNIQDFSFETLPTKLKTNESNTQDDDNFSKLNNVTSLNNSLNKSPISSKILETNADNSRDVLTSVDSSKYNNLKETSLSPSSSYTSTVPLKDPNIANMQDPSFETLPAKLKTSESNTQDVDDYFSKLINVTSLNDSLSNSSISSKIMEDSLRQIEDMQFKKKEGLPNYTKSEENSSLNNDSLTDTIYSSSISVGSSLLSHENPNNENDKGNNRFNRLGVANDDVNSRKDEFGNLQNPKNNIATIEVPLNYPQIMGSKINNLHSLELNTLLNADFQEIVGQNQRINDDNDDPINNASAGPILKDIIFDNDGINRNKNNSNISTNVQNRDVAKRIFYTGTCQTNTSEKENKGYHHNPSTAGNNNSISKNIPTNSSDKKEESFRKLNRKEDLTEKGDFELHADKNDFTFSYDTEKAIIEDPKRSNVLQPIDNFRTDRICDVNAKFSKVKILKDAGKTSHTEFVDKILELYEENKRNPNINYAELVKKYLDINYGTIWHVIITADEYCFQMSFEDILIFEYEDIVFAMWRIEE